MKSTIVATILVMLAFMFLPKVTFFAAAGGLLVGWNVLEQPAIVKHYWDKAAAWVEERRS